jgi:hypothetical protein
MAEYAAGIYMTTKFLPGHEADVAPNMLVLIRTDGEFGPASVLKTVGNEHNQWKFGMPGIKLDTGAGSTAWFDSLRKVPHEGFYRLTREFSYGDGGRWVENAIVQLGYTNAGEPILFIAQRRNPLLSNVRWFSDKGVKVSLEDIEGLIEPMSWFQEQPQTN